jgi:uncharacterized protein YqhQ
MPSDNGIPKALGGQAVIEGVMIRGPEGMAVCVRKPDGELAFRQEPAKTAGRLRNVPIVRGIATLGDTLTQGMKAMVWSAQVAAGKEPEEPSKVEIAATVAVSTGLAAAVFLLGPAAATKRLEKRLGNKTLASLAEGPVRLSMLLGYLRTIGRLPQAQRLFAYHGAEHRAIQAYEADEPLEIASLRRFPNAHVRCGTSFLLTTMVISSVVYAALGPMSMRARLLTRLALTPLVAGLSYEAIRFAATAPGIVRSVVFRPNMALQSMTTRDPDEAQMEVAIAAVKAALELGRTMPIEGEATPISAS